MAETDTQAQMPSGGVPEQVAFLLLPEFPLYALIPAIEALRIANQNAGQRLFHVRLLSVDGQQVRASNGMTLTTECGLDAVGFVPTVFVVAGNRPTQHLGKPVLAWLRRLARHGALLGGIDTGTFALAAAGLLDGYQVTLHWEAVHLFTEQFPVIETVEQLFVIDRNRLTCAGGNASLDLMLHLIAARHGQALAQLVADGFVHGRLRPDDDPQRTDPETALGPVHPMLAKVVRAMVANLDQPLSTVELAMLAGVSVRQLQRLVRDRFGDTPGGYYLKLRLQTARNELFYGDEPIQEIAAATGFSSPSVFCRAFKARFGLGPREFRRRFSDDRLARFRPEIRQQLSLPDATVQLGPSTKGEFRRS